VNDNISDISVSLFLSAGNPPTVFRNDCFCTSSDESGLQGWVGSINLHSTISSFHFAHSLGSSVLHGHHNDFALINSLINLVFSFCVEKCLVEYIE
jgi:hypothetical protein